MNFYSSLLYFYSPRNLEEELEEVESRTRNSLSFLSLSLSRFIVWSGARQRGMPRNFAMQMGCNWPTAVSDQFKGSFPGSAILHIRALRDETRRARARGDESGDHTHAAQRALHVHPPAAISDRPLLDSLSCGTSIPFHDSPASFEINQPFPSQPRVENGN